MSNLSLNQEGIRNLDDQKLQLAYMLGGIKMEDEICRCGSFWTCDISCYCNPVEDDERLEKARNFITRHNISNDTFLRLALTYLRGNFHSYKGDFGSLIPELDRAILDYHFNHSTSSSFKENDLKEKELLELIERESEIEGTKLNCLLTSYSITPVDFIILAKTSLNYAYRVGRGFEVKDLPKDLIKLLEDYDLRQSREFVQSYRKDFEDNTKVEENVLDGKDNISFVKRVRNKIKRRKEKKSLFNS